MTFKNQKEEVIEIEMTSYGKQLLSKGKFKPVYYAFFDDDILYDARYAGQEEEQNYAQTRILEETPRTRNQIHFSSIEREVKKQIEEVRTKESKLGEAFQLTPMNYSLTSSLGKASLSTDYAPSWDITLHGASFESQTITKGTGDEKTIFIPQMNLLDPTYITKVLKIEDPTIGYENSYNNGVAIEIENKDFIIEIDEIHTDSLRENYDIELFLVEDAIEDGKSVENLIQLMFMKDIRDNVMDGILVDEVQFRVEPEIDETYVEYYLDISIDKDIEASRLCELGYRTDFSKRGYIRVECDKLGENSRMGQIYDPFAAPVDPFGDDC